MPVGEQLNSNPLTNHTPCRLDAIGRSAPSSLHSLADCGAVSLNQQLQWPWSGPASWWSFHHSNRVPPLACSLLSINHHCLHCGLPKERGLTAGGPWFGPLFLEVMITRRNWGLRSPCKQSEVSFHPGSTPQSTGCGGLSWGAVSTVGILRDAKGKRDLARTLAIPKGSIHQLPRLHLWHVDQSLQQ